MQGSENEAAGREREMLERPRRDEDLMQAFAGGSTEAFGELFARYKQPLYGFFRRRVTNAEEADELTQDTFVAVLRAAPRYRPSASFRTYLYAIGFRILRSHRRKAAFRAVFHVDAPEIREAVTRNTADADLLLRDALGRLDSQDAEILKLREFEQLSYADIAEVLELPVNTVRSRLFRARTALHDVLATPAPGIVRTNLTEYEERI